MSKCLELRLKRVDTATTHFFYAEYKLPRQWFWRTFKEATADNSGLMYKLLLTREEAINFIEKFQSPNDVENYIWIERGKIKEAEKNIPPRIPFYKKIGPAQQRSTVNRFPLENK